MNKQALTEALAQELHQPTSYSDEQWQNLGIIESAARLVERLLPGECEFIAGERHPNCNYLAHFYCNKCGWLKNPPCCHDGQLWDEGIVKAVAKALSASLFDDWDGLSENLKGEYRKQAVAVLSALVELLTEKVET